MSDEVQAPEWLLAGQRAAGDGGAPEHLDQLATLHGARAAARGRALSEVYAELLASWAAAGEPADPEVLAAVAQGYVEARDLGAGGGHPLSGALTRLTALHRISRAATASLDLDGMLRTVVHVVRETMAADSGSIFLYDAGSNTLVLRASVGLNPEATGMVTLPLGAGITGIAAVKREIVAAPDAARHPAYLSYPLIGDNVYTSHVSVPLALRSPSRLVGVLNILSRQRRVFDRDELAFLQTAADEIAIAIENAQLYNQADAELQQRISQLALLQRLTKTLAATLDLPELLRLVGEQAVALTRAVAVEIYRVPRDGAAGLDLLSRFPEERAGELEAANEAVRLLVDDAMESAAPRRRAGREDELLVEVLPLLTGRRPVGAICLFFATEMSAAPESLLHAFSDVVAMALENAELYQEARRGYTRASVLLQEMHHRVRNNLQTVAALLSMQARHAGDAGWSEPLREAVSRIQSIAAVHDVLTGENLRETTLETLARHVAKEASATLIPTSSRIELVVESAPVRVSSREATVLALLINEFVANAVLHGLAGRERGHVTIGARVRSGRVELIVADDGRGLLPEFALDRAGLGLQIARGLVRDDLGGELEVSGNPEGGATARVIFPSSLQG
ncbi:MAG TPA: GAF domain-containing protein [Thermomicrobiaceae bacterium]|nr:GAF domain-containing protein [Thermomicrobiaceae bacterium]